MAIAGARAGKAAAPANGGRAGPSVSDRTEYTVTDRVSDRAEYTAKHSAARPAWRNPRTVTVTVAAVGVLLTAGGVTLASFSKSGGQAGRAGALPPGVQLHSPAPSPVSSTSSAPMAASSAPMVPPASMVSSAPSFSSAPSASSAPARPAPSASPTTQIASPAAASVQVAGVGCPGGGVIPDNAPTGPGWTPAGGGWTGNGCDGSTLWTMDPNGKQPVPSTLTWTFSPAGASQCTLAVFIPTQNALGVSDYSVSAGSPGASQVIGTVPVSQSAEAGQWLTLGTFPVSGPSLQITAAPAPDASGHGHHGAIAASAARAACT